MKQKATLPPECTGHKLCPLSQISPGTTVCIKELATSPEMKMRLRELGFFEDQRVRLLSGKANYICQICNARLGISGKIASAIMVQALPEQKPLAV